MPILSPRRWSTAGSHPSLWSSLAVTLGRGDTSLLSLPRLRGLSRLNVTTLQPEVWATIASHLPGLRHLQLRDVKWTDTMKHWFGDTIPHDWHWDVNKWQGDVFQSLPPLSHVAEVVARLDSLEVHNSVLAAPHTLQLLKAGVQGRLKHLHLSGLEVKDYPASLEGVLWYQVRQYRAVKVPA